MKKFKNSLQIPRSDVLFKDIAEKILNDIKTEFKPESLGERLTVIAIFAQQGAAAKNCDGNMEITMFKTSIKLSAIRKIFNVNSSNLAPKSQLCS